MVFSKPVLNTYEATDTNYIAKFNNDNTALDNAFSGIQGDINTIQTNTGTAVFEELTRKGPSAESWPDGVFGAYSLEFSSTNIASGSLTLKSTNEDQVSVIVLNGERRQHAGDLNFDLNTLSLTDNDYDVYLGVTGSGDFDFVAQASLTQSSVTVPLYKVPITVSNSGNTYALQANTTPSRLSKTVYWDNTVEQLRQETPQILPFFVPALSTTTDSQYVPRFTIPFDHYIDSATVFCQEIGFGGSLTTELKEGSNTVGAFSSLTSSSPSSANMVFSTGFSADYAYAANRTYHFAFTQASGTATGVTCVLNVRRAYNAPLYS